MYFIRLIYASKISSSFEKHDIEDILNKSKQNNKLVNVTGALIYNNSYFLQCLEGSRIQVNQLYHKILLDKRHCEPSILNYQEISQRDFHQWHMAYIPSSKISGDLILKFSGQHKLNPYSMSGESCYLLMKEMQNLKIFQN